MLITGPWQEVSSNYSCLFDQISVPASLIQPGVLRCYCPGKSEEGRDVHEEVYPSHLFVVSMFRFPGWEVRMICGH